MPTGYDMSSARQTTDTGGAFLEIQVKMEIEVNYSFAHISTEI